MMKRALHNRKIRIILLSVLAVLTTLSVLCGALAATYGAQLPAQQEAKRFRGDSSERFAQVSAFFKVGEEKTLSDIYTFRKSMESALVDASLEAEAGQNLWADAYSAQSTVTVTSDKATAEVTTLGVGGKWFLFHPLELRSGAYIEEDDLMHDKVILDEELAWKLFGGVDLAGLEVTISGKPYVVAGVVAREDDFATQDAYGDTGAGMIMYYDAMNALTDDGVDISCYELVCADPISGFALDLLQTGFPEAVTVENSDRFGLEALLKVVKSFSQRSVAADGVVFPYWEKAAQIMEAHAALMLVLSAVFGLFPAVCLVWALADLLRAVKARLSEVLPRRWEKIADRIREKQRLRLVARAEQQYKKH